MICVVYQPLLLSENNFSQTFNTRLLYMLKEHVSNPNFTALKKIPPSTWLKGVNFPLCYLQSFFFFYIMFTLVWVFRLWNDAGCIFTIAPTCTSSHWSEICRYLHMIYTQISVGQAICASLWQLDIICSMAKKHSTLGPTGRSLHSRIQITQTHTLECAPSPPQEKKNE